ncbi:glucosidase II [Umbelopsis sp. WA50703]
MPLRSWALACLAILSLFILTEAVKKEDFKTCSQSAFCRRNRALADSATDQSNWQSPYTLVKESIRFSNNFLTADVKNTETNNVLILELQVLADNTVRVRMDEKSPLRQRYQDHAQFTLVDDAKPVKPFKSGKNTDGVVKITLDESGSRKVVVSPSPLRVDFMVNDSPVVTLNDRGFFNFEHLRSKESHKPKMVTQKNEDGTETVVEAEEEKDLWEETFRTWTDSKPNGPESIGMDISFHGFGHVYGIPEHASSLSLKETRGGEGAYTEPYRLYNTDVFEYEMDSPAALYGSIPFMLAHRKNESVGVFWMNPSETWIDIVKTAPENQATGVQKVFKMVKSAGQKKSTKTHWYSEAGVLDMFVFLGPSSKDVFRQYTKLTGKSAMPQSFAIAYHQCRWNYINQNDVREVDDQFDVHDIPYDVIWLDIEHNDGKRYFTWDEAKFPDPSRMQHELSQKGRKLVTIIDPHIKRDDDYYICKEAKDKNLFVKQPSGPDYEGWCWPGQSSWVDYTNPAARKWWAEQFKFDHYKHSTDALHVWNDMNEPSVFNGPEITMPKDMVHHGGWEHRVLHNVYGQIYHGSTADGLKERLPVQQRPFVLSRAFYAGSQRFGSIWTGDNMAQWDALQASMPMIMSVGVAGLPFAGADVGGFFNNPSHELLVRWYQAGAFQPFFRAHAHIDTKRREPWLVGEPYTDIIRSVVRERYALLPYWYNLFQEAHENGTPIMRPLVVEYPDDETVFAMDDQFLVGSGILVKPVTEEGATQTNIYFPPSDIWYDLHTHDRVQGKASQVVSAPLDVVPAYYRGGHIIPRRERLRRSSHAMSLDPFTLVIAVDANGEANGSLYLDDGQTFGYEKNEYLKANFNFKNGVLTYSIQHTNPVFASSIAPVRVERLIILGHPSVSKVVATDASGKRELEVEKSKNGKLVVRDPAVLITEDGWKVELA